MKKLIAIALTSLLLNTAVIHAHDSKDHSNQLKLDNLMRATLAGAKNTEVILSHVLIPPNTKLPKHWHPGEEFVYVMDGSVTLWQKGKKELFAKKGDTVKVPLKQVHTAITSKEGVELVVFRVHEKGQPERIKVE